MRILLVEDEGPIAAVIRRGLEGARYSVDVAADGAAGLELALENPYALIILDLMLPRLDGWTICARPPSIRTRARATSVVPRPLSITAIAVPSVSASSSPARFRARPIAAATGSSKNVTVSGATPHRARARVTVSS